MHKKDTKMVSTTAKRGEKASTKKTKGKAQVQVEETTTQPVPTAMDDFALPTREVVKPDNQLQLTEQELGEEVANVLTANNPSAPKNLARFNMKERCYKFEPMVEQTILHYSSDGWLLHKASEESKRQMEAEKLENEATMRFQSEINRAAKEREAGLDVEPPDDSRQLRNQFNFSERAAQTFNFTLRDRATLTDPPPTATVSGSCNLWEIYDEYIHDFDRHRVEELSKAKAVAGKKAGSATVATSVVTKDAGEVDILQSNALSKALRIVDRTVNQNSYDEITMDYKYWEDTTDAFRPGEGSLLPLWKFQPEAKAAHKHVTSLCWNSQYKDLFAVGYGSFNFSRQGSGCISIFSLKNPSHPEYSFATKAGVMALHFHTEFCNLLAVGCYDGSVLVFDIHLRNSEPLYVDSVKQGRHCGPVWQICWLADELQKLLQFVSISSDGSVVLWTLRKAELSRELLMVLQRVPDLKPQRLPGSQEDSSPDTQQELDLSMLTNVSGGLCMDFSKVAGQEHVYLVGTEEGLIHKCSRAYGSQYLSTYKAHNLAVYAVKWNLIHPHIFMSASADWTVKLWDNRMANIPVMVFDLGAAVGDAVWAPYSSTVFAAATDDGRVHVFDLNENTNLPLCSQKRTKKSKLMKMIFNQKHALLLVGDSLASVYSLKLSPNLRANSKVDKGQTFEALEIEKLNQIIEIACKSSGAT